MKLIFIRYAVIFGFAGLGWLAVSLYRRFRRQAPLPPQAPERCEKGGAHWIQTAHRAVGLPGKPAPVVEFLGLFCARCRKAVSCRACGRTPEIGAVVEKAKFPASVLGCCPKPDFRLLDPASAPEPYTPDDEVNGEIIPIPPERRPN